MTVHPLTLGCAVFVFLVGLGACGGAAFDFGGPTIKPGVGAPTPVDAVALDGTEALAPPALTVRPAAPIRGWFAPATVVSHAPDPAGRPGAMTLVVRTSEADVVEVSYRLGPVRRIPVTEGEAILIRLYPASTQGAPSDALVVATDGGGALAIITRRDGLPPGVLPQQAAVTISTEPARLVYTEVRELPSLCMARIDHQTLRLEVDGVVTHVVPGEIARVQIGAVPFEMIAYDASVARGPRCPDAPVAHLSYALLRTRP